VYDGRRVVQERSSSNGPTVSYVRGLDLSGSMEGAGGIGGLLARSSGYQSASGAWTSHALYHADGGGNVTFLSPSTYSGTLTRYSYDAYGRSVFATGPLAAANVYRFSSKELHAPSGHYYYGFRFYDPQAQRWINRDPLGEEGGVNLYGFVGNGPIGAVDPDGRWPWDVSEVEWKRLSEQHGARPYELCDQVERAIQCPSTLKASSWVTKGMAHEASDGVKEVGEEVLFGVAGVLTGQATRCLRVTPCLKPAEAAKGAERGGLNLFRAGPDGLATREAATGWRTGDRMLHLPNQGSDKANWAQNSGRLRQEMRAGEPIFDSYRNSATGLQIPAGVTPSSGGRFLNAERKLLESRGWQYSPSTGA